MPESPSLSGPELVHLANAHMPLITAYRGSHRAPGSPLGSRAVGAVEGRWEGDRLMASVLPPSADWATVAADGSVTHTAVSIVLETDDASIIFVTYVGRVTTNATLYAAMTFETGDPRYMWINSVVAIAKGSVFLNDDGTPAGVDYAIFEAR